ncbi:MAG: hypothetical protein OEY70_16895, partial [Acidimicrobiia bacterium]|nr:hypothetical protein [Acidimicrobiia bacterium]
GRLEGATALVSAAEGGAWLVESKAGQVSRIDGEGGIEPVVTGLDRPQSVAEAADGTLWVTSAAGAVCAVRDGSVTARHDGFGTPQGIAVVASGIGGGVTVVVADPARRAVVGLDPASGQRRDLVTGAPIGLAVEGARAPHAFSPLEADGDGVLVGCDGDGSVRRLTLA